MRSTLHYFLLLLVLAVPQILTAQSVQHPANTDSALRKLERTLYSFDTDKGDLIPVYYVQLDDLNLRLDTLATLITHHSPVDVPLKDRLVRARQYFDSIRPLILGKMERIELVLYDEALKARNTGDSTRANAMFVASLKHNPNYGPAAYELIKFNLTPAQAMQAIEYYESYGNRIDSATNPYYFNLIHSLKPAVLDNIITLSGRLIDQGLSTDALEILKNADLFNQANPSPLGKEKLFSGRKAAHNGMYNSLITIADRAYSARKWELARYYFEQARVYQQQHSDYLPDALATVMGLEKTQTASVKENVSERKMVRTRHKHGRKRIARHHRSYRQTARNNQRPQPVIQAVDTMMAYQSRVSAQARLPLLDSVHAAYFLAWKNEIDRAREVLSRAKTLQHQYFLENDSEVIAAIKELETRIHDRRCFTARSNYEACIYRALSQFIRSDYLAGKDFLDKADSIYSQHTDCGFSDSLLVSTRRQYQGLFRWQQHWNEARQAFSVRDYPAFLTEYEATYAIYREEKLSSKGLSMFPLVEYLQNLNDADILPAITMSCLHSGRMKEAWELLNSLKSKGLKPGEFDKQLTVAGKNMAMEDRNQGNTFWLDKIKSGGSWFKKARKSYFRSINSPTNPKS